MYPSTGSNLPKPVKGTIAALLMFALTACSAVPAKNSSSSGSPAPADASQGGKVTVSFWNSFTGSDADTLKKIVDSYNKKNAGKIEVKMDIMPADQFNQKLPPSIATATAPDVVALSGSAAAPYIQNGSLLPLDDYYTTEGVNKGDYEPSAINLANSGGKLYLVPMQVFGIQFYWNKALFKAAGLDPEKPPADFNQLADYAVKLTNASKNQYGFLMPIKGAPQYYSSFIWGNGGDIINGKKSVLDSPENVKTFQWLADLAVNKKVTPKGLSGVETDKLMLAGQAGMYITGPWLAAGLKQQGIDFGVSLPPKGSSTQATIADGIGFGIPKGISEPKKKAVYDFLKYWNSTEIGKQWSLGIGFPPYLKSVANDPEIKANAIITQMSRLGDAGKVFLPGLVSADRINSDVMFPLMETIVSGNDPATSLKKASQSIDDMLKSEK